MHFCHTQTQSKDDLQGSRVCIDLWWQLFFAIMYSIRKYFTSQWHGKALYGLDELKKDLSLGEKKKNYAISSLEAAPVKDWFQLWARLAEGHRCFTVSFQHEDIGKKSVSECDAQSCKWKTPWSHVREVKKKVEMENALVKTENRKGERKGSASLK